ncbi:hypothetical protein [Leptospira mayottensis]|uniref:hypothetical protein n=1 Tax=Leptospira mayottensis TaxID=1137606 RepID=UPI0002BED873|nr:hypothetical protein [Leptospira mayottensis]
MGRLLCTFYKNYNGILTTFYLCTLNVRGRKKFPYKSLMSWLFLGLFLLERRKLNAKDGFWETKKIRKN